MIKVELEDVEDLKKWGMGLSNMLESCTFCQKPTRYWNDAKNSPVCLCCADMYEEGDLENPQGAIDKKQLLSDLLRNALTLSRHNRKELPKIPLDWQDRTEYALMRSSFSAMAPLVSEIVDCHKGYEADADQKPWLFELRNFLSPEAVAA